MMMIVERDKKEQQIRRFVRQRLILVTTYFINKQEI